MLMLHAPAVTRTGGMVHVSLREATEDFLHDLTRAMESTTVMDAFSHLRSWMDYDADSENPVHKVQEHIADATFDLQVALAAGGCQFYLAVPAATASVFGRALLVKAVANAS